jgi:hypothetical protein
MMKWHGLWVGMLLLPTCVAGWAQDNSAQPQEGTVPQPAVPAYGQSTDTTPTPSSENPPISGLDMPNLEPHAAPLSYLQAGAHFSQSVDSNIENSLGGSEVSTITQLFGTLELQRLWNHYALSLDYVGGVGYYDASGVGLRQIQEMGLDQKVTWKRGQFNVRDVFSYQPEGSFGTSYGGVGVGGAALGGESVFFWRHRVRRFGAGSAHYESFAGERGGELNAEIFGHGFWGIWISALFARRSGTAKRLHREQSNNGASRL